MINNKDKIDDLFKESLEDYTITPSRGLWNKIEIRFFGSGANRWYYLRYVLIALLLVGIVTVVWLNLPEGDERSVGQNQRQEAAAAAGQDQQQRAAAAAGQDQRQEAAAAAGQNERQEAAAAAGQN